MSLQRQCADGSSGDPVYVWILSFHTPLFSIKAKRLELDIKTQVIKLISTFICSCLCVARRVICDHVTVRSDPLMCVIDFVCSSRARRLRPVQAHARLRLGVSLCSRPEGRPGGRYWADSQNTNVSRKIAHVHPFLKCLPSHPLFRGLLDFSWASNGTFAYLFFFRGGSEFILRSYAKTDDKQCGLLDTVAAEWAEPLNDILAYILFNGRSRTSECSYIAYIVFAWFSDILIVFTHIWNVMSLQTFYSVLWGKKDGQSVK